MQCRHSAHDFIQFELILRIVLFFISIHQLKVKMDGDFIDITVYFHLKISIQNDEKVTNL